MRQTKPRRTRRIVLAFAVAAGLLVDGCAGPSASAPMASSTPASASGASVSTPTPVSTLEATTETADEAPPGAITITLSIPPPRFAPDEVSARAGTVVFFLANPREDFTFAHNMLIGTDTDSPALAKSETLLAGQSAIFTVYDLTPGTYMFWCTIQDHLADGMVGTLTVTR